MTHQRIILVVAALLLGMATLAYPRMGSDTSTFTYVGQTIVDGGMPYRDAWDLKAPAIFYVYAVPIALFGKSHVGVQAADLLWQLATALVLFAIAVRIYGRREIGLLAGVLYLFAYYSASYWNMGQAEGFLNLPLALSIFWLLRALADDRSVAWCISGVCVAGATLFKVPFGLMGILMIASAITLRPRDWNHSVRRLSALALGFAAPLLLCVIYFQAKGALWDLLTTQFLAGPQHALLNENGHYVGCMIDSLRLPARFPLYTLGLLSLAPVCSSVVRKQRVSLATKLLWGWFAVGLVVLFMHGEFLGYHFLPLFAPLAILSAEFLYSVYAAGRTRRNATWWLASAAFVFLLFCASYKFSKNVAYEWWTVHGGREVLDWYPVSAYVKKHTSPGDRIFVWGNRSAIYVDTDLKAASRFLDIYHIALPPKGLDYRGILLQEFQAARPKYFILHAVPKPSGECAFSEIDQKETFTEFAAFRALIAEDYQLESPGSLGPYEVYRRKR